MSSISAELGVALRVATIFDNPTVAAVAARVDETGRTGTASGPRSRNIPEGTAVPLSPAQERLWFLDSAAGSGTYLLGLAVDFDVAPDPDALALAFTDVVTRHQSLRTVFPLVDSVPQQVVLPAEQSKVRLERVGNIGNIEAHVSAMTTVGLGLAEQPPLRAVLYEPQHTLVLLIHHIIGDEWSQSKLLGDLTFAYNARRAGRPPVFEPLPCSIRMSRSGSANVPPAAGSTTGRSNSQGSRWNSAGARTGHAQRCRPIAVPACTAPCRRRCTPRSKRSRRSGAPVSS